MKLFYRIYQKLLKLVSRFMPWRTPLLIEGEGSLMKLPIMIKTYQIERILIVSDRGIVKAGLLEPLLEVLKEFKIHYTVFDETKPNPSIETIEEALKMYQTNQCQGIIAFGGGSPIDCAKVVGARVARPKKSIEKMRGILKIRKKTPPLFAVPTTAGTGSEATLAAVVSNPKTQDKFAINDHVLIPDVAVLDPNLTLKLPKYLTAQTGMDALTHAVEAYIGKSNTKETLKWSEDAVKLIYEYLETAVNKPDNIEARTQMLKASYYAGLAFTRAYVGNVHAMAHTLGGFYGTPHGFANAMILPYVLRYYGTAVEKQLAKLAKIVGLETSTNQPADLAKAFIDWIEEMNQKFEIPKTIETIEVEDISIMVKRAHKEANPLYPVPKIFSKRDFDKLYRQIRH